jgi:hypothetical protein
LTSVSNQQLMLGLAARDENACLRQSRRKQTMDGVITNFTRPLSTDSVSGGCSPDHRAGVIIPGIGDGNVYRFGYRTTFVTDGI